MSMNEGAEKQSIMTNKNELSNENQDSNCRKFYRKLKYKDVAYTWGDDVTLKDKDGSIYNSFFIFY